MKQTPHKIQFQVGSFLHQTPKKGLQAMPFSVCDPVTQYPDKICIEHYSQNIFGLTLMGKFDCGSEIYSIMRCTYLLTNKQNQNKYM